MPCLHRHEGLFGPPTTCCCIDPQHFGFELKCIIKTNHLIDKNNVRYFSFSDYIEIFLKIIWKSCSISAGYIPFSQTFPRPYCGMKIVSLKRIHLSVLLHFGFIGLYCYRRFTRSNIRGIWRKSPPHRRFPSRPMIKSPIILIVMCFITELWLRWKLHIW